MTEMTCRHCDGTGKVAVSQRCPECDGHPAQFGDCPRCDTEGWLAIDSPCAACSGSGTVEVVYA